MRSKRPTLLFIITLTTITIIFWIAYEVYLILITKPALSVDPKILETVSPNLDIETLDNLNQRIYFEEGKETNAVFKPPEEAGEESSNETPSPSPDESQ